MTDDECDSDGGAAHGDYGNHNDANIDGDTGNMIVEELEFPSHGNSNSWEESDGRKNMGFALYGSFLQLPQ